MYSNAQRRDVLFMEKFRKDRRSTVHAVCFSVVFVCLLLFFSSCCVVFVCVLLCSYCACSLFCSTNIQQPVRQAAILTLRLQQQRYTEHKTRYKQNNTIQTFKQNRSQCIQHHHAHNSRVCPNPHLLPLPLPLCSLNLLSLLSRFKLRMLRETESKTERETDSTQTQTLRLSVLLFLTAHSQHLLRRKHQHRETESRKHRDKHYSYHVP